MSQLKVHKRIHCQDDSSCFIEVIELEGVEKEARRSTAETGNRSSPSEGTRLETAGERLTDPDLSSRREEA